MKNITKLGNLKDITLQAKEEDFFSLTGQYNSVSLSLENYYGDTIQGFLLYTKDNEVYIKDTYYINKDLSNDLNDYGVKAEYKDGYITIHCLGKVLELADITNDYLFEPDYPEHEDLSCIRLQLSNINLYEVVIAKTETKAGKLYVYATSEDEAERIVDRDLEEHLNILERNNELSIMNSEQEINNIYTTNINPENYHTFIENDVIYEKGITSPTVTDDANIDINPNRDYLLNQLQELQADFEDFDNDELIENRECMLERINECLKALFESDNDNL
ncbi:MAG: hypothetical protein IJ086_05735 [Clostridium sp.]|nr:hypothetical protein [Clostridium sp.]